MRHALSWSWAEDPVAAELWKAVVGDCGAFADRGVCCLAGEPGATITSFDGWVTGVVLLLLLQTNGMMLSPVVDDHVSENVVPVGGVSGEQPVADESYR